MCFNNLIAANKWLSISPEKGAKNIKKHKMKGIKALKLEETNHLLEQTKLKNQVYIKWYFKLHVKR